jgi:hypothetical protein
MIEYWDAANTYGDILDIACPLFVGARRNYQDLYGVHCPRPPAKEILTPVGNHVVLFRDPPGVHGTGSGSGGKYAAVGAVLFWAGSEMAAAKVTCILPPTQRYLCTAIVDDTIRRLTSN